MWLAAMTCNGRGRPPGAVRHAAPCVLTDLPFRPFVLCSQALELYRRVRLQTLVATKASVLASVPCNSATLTEHGFEVEQYLEVRGGSGQEGPQVLDGCLRVKKTRCSRLLHAERMCTACQPKTTLHTPLSLRKHDRCLVLMQLPVDTARVRMLGTSNRVIGGLLLFNQRGLPAACANSRFSSIGGTCKRGEAAGQWGLPASTLGSKLAIELRAKHAVRPFYPVHPFIHLDAGLDTAPYGLDPVFKSGTSLYNPDLDSAEAVAIYYNCSALATATYNVTREWAGGMGRRRALQAHTCGRSAGCSQTRSQLAVVSTLCDAEEGSTGLAAPHITNAPPYCAELFSPRSLPYGFHATTLRQFGDGFPVLFDINLDAAGALHWLAFIQASGTAVQL